MGAAGQSGATALMGPQEGLARAGLPGAAVPTAGLSVSVDSSGPPSVSWAHGVLGGHGPVLEEPGTASGHGSACVDRLEAPTWASSSPCSCLARGSDLSESPPAVPLEGSALVGSVLTPPHTHTPPSASGLKSW